MAIPRAAPVTGNWQFREPRTADNNVLIETPDGFAVDPAWQVARVTYDYQKWSRAALPALGSQTIERNGDTFMRDNVPLTQGEMETFVASLTHFHPTQIYLYHRSWTHDDPLHTVQITGQDGQHFLLIASSTGNVGGGPWNLVYNDRLYAQYDGAFSAGMAAVFEYRSHEYEQNDHSEMASTSGMDVLTEGSIAQLDYGFDGLLADSEGFAYRAALQDSVIEGRVVGRRLIGGNGGKAIGDFTTLDTITIHDPAVAPCEITPIEMDARVEAGWTFRCAVRDVAEGDVYLYPIGITMGDEEGEIQTLTGTLSGVWSENQRLLRLPLPPFLQRLLAENESADTLLAQHEHALASYIGSLDPLPPHLPHDLFGNISFFGTTSHGTHPIRYQITTSFALSPTDTLYWVLTPDETTLLVKDAVALPQNEALLARYPDTTLHLGYFVKYPVYRYYPPLMVSAYAAQCGTSIRMKLRVLPLYVGSAIVLRQGRFMAAWMQTGRFVPAMPIWI